MSFLAVLIIISGFQVQSLEAKVGLLVIGDSTSRLFVLNGLIPRLSCIFSEDNPRDLRGPITSVCDNKLVSRVDYKFFIGVSPIDGDYFEQNNYAEGDTLIANSWKSTLKKLNRFIGNQTNNESFRIILFLSNFWDCGRYRYQMEHRSNYSNFVPLKNWLIQYQTNYTAFTHKIKSEMKPNDKIIYQVPHLVSKPFFSNLVPLLNIEIVNMGLRDHRYVFRTDMIFAQMEIDGIAATLSNDGIHQTEVASLVMSDMLMAHINKTLKER